MRRLILPVILVVVIAGLLLALAPWDSGSAPQLLTATVRRGSLTDTVSAVGILEPSQLVQVGAQMTGQLKALYVVPGNHVAKGDLIAEIDSTQQRNDLRMARAALAEAEATRRSRWQQLGKAELALTRQRTLYSGSAGSGADYQDAVTAVEIARIDLELSAAQIDRALVEVERAEANLGYTRIEAPIAGRVLGLAVKAGQTLSAVQTVPLIGVIANTEIMVVRAQVSEADVGRIRPGQSLWFTTLGDRRTRHRSIVREVEPAPSSILTAGQATTAEPGAGGGATSQAVYFNVLFEAPNPDGALMPMMTAEVNIVVGQVDHALIAPTSALSGPDGQGFHIAGVLGANKEVQERKVRIGLANQVEVEILDGLKEGDTLLLRTDGDPASESASGRE